MVFNIYNFLEFKLALTEYFWYVYLLVFVWKPNLLCLVVFYTSFVTSVYQDISLSIDMGLFSNLALKHPICLNIFLLTLITSYSNMVVFVGFIALVLGSWWAGSEFNWGGFWSFDFVENSILLLFVFVLWHHHNSILKKKNIDYLYMFVVLQFFFLLKFNTIPSIHSFISEITSHYYFIVVIWLLLTCLTSGYKPLFILIYTILYTYYTYVYVVVLIVLIFLYLFASWYKPKNHNILYHLILYIVGTILYKIHSILELNTSPAIKLLISYSYTLVLGTGSLIIHNIFPTSLLNKPLLVILGGSWLYKFNSFNLL